MQISTEGMMFLVRHEGIVLTRYLDSRNIWTIGIGHTKAAGPPDPSTFKGKLSVEDAFDLLAKDIEKYEQNVRAAVRVPLKQHEYDALVSFHYNTGAIGKATFVKKLNAGDRAGAIKGIMDWRKPPEIVPRRTAERDLFRDGKYPEPFATIYEATPAGKVLWSSGKRVDLRKELNAPAPPAPKPVDAPKPVPAAPEPPKAQPAPQGGFWAWLRSLFA